MPIICVLNRSKAQSWSWLDFTQRQVDFKYDPITHLAGAVQSAIEFFLNNAFNQILIGKILEKHQIKTYIASNGKEAIELIAK